MYPDKRGSLGREKNHESDELSKNCEKPKGFTGVKGWCQLGLESRGSDAANKEQVGRAFEVFS